MNIRIMSEEKTAWWGGVFVIGFFLSLGLEFVGASWAGPVSSPSGDNIGAPVTTGTASQVKNPTNIIGGGGLTVGGTTIVTGWSTVSGFKMNSGAGDGKVMTYNAALGMGVWR